MQKLLFLALITYILVIPVGFLFNFAFGVATGVPTVAPPSASVPFWVTLGYLIGGLVVGVVVVSIFYKYVQVIYPYLMMFICVSLFLLSVFVVTNIDSIFLLAVSIIITMLVYRQYKYTYFNFFAVVFSVLWAAWIGFSWSPLLVFAGFIILCIYDLVAVFFTNFMMGLAQKLLTAKVIPPAFILEGSIEDVRNRVLGKKPLNDKAPTPRLLGGGDLVFPGAFIVSLSLYVGILFGALAVLGAMMGLVLNFIIVLKRKIALPALPLLFACQIGFVGLGLALHYPFDFFASAFAIAGGYLIIDSLAEWKIKKNNKAKK